MRLARKWNTLRNQILAVYLFVLLLVLFTVSYLIFNQVATMLKDNAEEQIQQTANEAIGRYDSLFEQLNLITKQMVTNDSLQSIMYNEWHGLPASFSDKQELITITSRLQANAEGIYVTELFNNDYQKIIPLDGPGLAAQIDMQWVELADQARGRLVWIGEDQLNPNYFLLIRSVRLIDQYFTNGGYLLIRVNKNYFQTQQTNEQDPLMIVTDQTGRLISSNYPQFTGQVDWDAENVNEIIDQESYLRISETSNETNWNVTMLTPMRRLTEGLPVLRTVIVISGLVGFIIFFILSYFLSTYITNPIHKLTDTMRRAGEGVLTLTPQSTASNEINELNDTYNQLAEQTNYLIQMVYERELIKSRTELKALQAQINPHFLFNTLDSLYWSLEEHDELELAEMVLSMSDLFRYTITRSNDEEWVYLKEEIAHIKHYMQIMKMRYGDRLTCQFDVEEELLTIRLPKLLIQPLVENAVLHGIGNRLGKGRISLTITKVQSHSTVFISVKDDGSGMSEERVQSIYQSIRARNGVHSSGNGMALVNVERRLQLYFNPDQTRGIQICSELNKGTEISFIIPMIKDEV